MGIDAWGWDGPLDRQAREALTRQEPGVFWAAHQANLPYSQIERLVNLGALPAFGFKVACFPLKIMGGSAGRPEPWRSCRIDQSGRIVLLVYHPSHNITALGFERLHPSDGRKYRLGRGGDDGPDQGEVDHVPQG